MAAAAAVVAVASGAYYFEAGGYPIKKALLDSAIVCAATEPV